MKTQVIPAVNVLFMHWPLLAALFWAVSCQPELTKSEFQQKCKEAGGTFDYDFDKQKGDRYCRCSDGKGNTTKTINPLPPASEKC